VAATSNFHIGPEISIGHLSHRETAVRLYLQETHSSSRDGGGRRAARASRQVGIGRSATMSQCLTFVQSDVIRLVAFDLILWIILARMMDVTFVGHVARMHPHDMAADPARFRVPTYVIADFESLCHE
jgi:hypothetical protein